MVSPLRSTDGQALFTDKASILNCWAEHFQTLFGNDRTVDNSVILQIPQQHIKEEMDLAPTLKEVIKSLDQPKNGNAADIDGIPPEIWKHGGTTLHSKLHKLFVCCWELPQDLIITLYKNKGEKSDCSNYKGITLFIAGKNPVVPPVAEHHLLQRANAASELTGVQLTGSGFSMKNAVNKTSDFLSPS